MMAALKAKLASLPGTKLEGMTVSTADDFAYNDPVDGSISKGQGVRVVFEGGSRMVMRLSGTGTEGATLRLYLERYEPKDGDLGQDPQAALAPIIAAAHALADIAGYSGKSKPDVVT
jgi:phosphoglucomutase